MRGPTSSPDAEQRPGAAEAARFGSFVPGVAVARSYRRAWLRKDLVAGVVLTALLVPQGMAYAELAGLPPVTGLYATLVPLLAYAVFGPSRILVLGPDSALAPLVAAAVIPVAGADPSDRVAVAGVLALMVGALLLAGGIARLGFLTDLLSKPVRLGYLAGIALIVIADQLPRLLGVPSTGSKFVEDARNFTIHIGEADPTTAVIGVSCLAIILLGPRIVPALPWILVAVAGSAAAVSLFDLDVAVVGFVPSGLPTPAIPSAPAGDLGRLALAAVRSRCSRLLTRVFSRGATPLGLAIASTRTASSAGSPRRTCPPASSRDSRSRAAHRGRPWPRRRGRARS